MGSVGALLTIISQALSLLTAFFKLLAKEEDAQKRATLAKNFVDSVHKGVDTKDTSDIEAILRGRPQS